MENSIRAEEGWFVSHLFFRIDRRRWRRASAAERTSAAMRLKDLIEEHRQFENCQIYCYSIWALKADFGFLIIDPDLQRLNELECEISALFPAGSLLPVYSFTSMSEVSEYLSQEQDYKRTLTEKEKLAPDSPEYRRKMEEFRKRMRVYIDERLYPRIPPHRVFCFYPMSKRRRNDANWYLLDFEERKRFMAGHAITGRKYGRFVKQLVTGSTGLDDWEWGVTLFADDPFYLKKIVYEMRYDEASARYAEFGAFFVGIQMEATQLLERLRLASGD
ncbi:MAG TPA: hydrogen peroxide-dependent heme synthase [Acidobacteriota bacterium]|nr:hydrogen peroxide-dependent heme synthase [Acidobacteriota bacterium]